MTPIVSERRKTLVDIHNTTGTAGRACHSLLEDLEEKSCAELEKGIGKKEPQGVIRYRNVAWFLLLRSVASPVPVTPVAKCLGLQRRRIFFSFFFTLML